MATRWHNNMVRTKKQSDGSEDHLVLTFEDTIDGRKISLNGIDITSWLSDFEVRVEAMHPNRVNMTFTGVEIRQIKRDDPFYGV